MSWRAAVDVAQELQRETGSHLFASQNDYKWVASHAEIALAMITNELKQLTVIPYPIPAESEVTASERQAVEEYYAEHSAWN